MKNINTFIEMSKKLFMILSPRQKRQGIVLLILMMLASTLEMLGIGIVIPFIIAMLEPEVILSNHGIRHVIEYLNVTEYFQIVYLTAAGIILVYIIKNAVIIAVNYYQIVYRNNLEKELSVRMLSSYAEKPYTFFLNINSAEILRGVNSDVIGTTAALDAYMVISSEGITCLLIGLFLICINPFMAISILCIAIITAVFIVLIFRKNTSISGEITREAFKDKFQYANQTVGGIKEILVLHKEKFFTKKFEEAAKTACKYNTQYLFIMKLPSRLIETIFLGALVILVCINMSEGGVSSYYIAELGALAVAAIRVLPSISNITNSMNALVYNRLSLEAAYTNTQGTKQQVSMKTDIEEARKESSHETSFRDKITVNNIYWRYGEKLEYVLEAVSFQIKRGETVAFIGESGAGKTTLVDILLGLLKPQEGRIQVDQWDVFEHLNEWSQMIGYVTQTLFILDEPIRNNVAFGIPEEEIDEEAVWKALEQAQLKEFVISLADGLDTVVGERGIRFSGGQRQRIAIARALYYNPDILVFDEATSALDSETEMAVMESIASFQQKKTIIIVAHRLSTIKNCDKIYEVKNGKVSLVDKELIRDKV